MTVGTEIFVQREDENGIVPLDRSILQDVLGPHAVGRDGKILGAKFSDGDWGDIDGAEEARIEHLCFTGGGERFMQAIWEFANRTNAYIFWIGESRCLAVTSEAALSELTDGISEAIGPAWVVADGAELLERIAETAA